MSDDTGHVFARLVGSIDNTQSSQSWDDVRVSVHHDAVCDLEEVRRAIPVLFGGGEIHEIRPLPSGRSGVVSSDDPDGACAVVQSCCDQQVYYSLNPIKQGAGRAKKKTVDHRRWFLIDVDTLRPDKDTSATDDEKEASGQLAIRIIDYLAGLGWPHPLVIDSGNGWHLLYRIALPNTDLSDAIIKACTYMLAEKFDNNMGIVDRATHDAPRIAKLPGTWARKGLDTPDRPHRLCQIIGGENPAVVPTPLLMSLGSPPAATNGMNGGSEGHPPDWDVVVVKASTLTNYVRRAIDSEGFKVAMSQGGNRNNTLNTAAFNLGMMAAWPEMDEKEARSTLLRAAERAGLEPRECLQTVASGWEAGRLEPRARLVEAQAKGKTDKVDDNEALTEGLDEIEPEDVKWLYENRIAPGFISIFAGRTGMGKSFVVCDLVARLSRGENLPYSNLLHPPMRTLFISEDSPRKVLGPRLLEMKAVRPMVRFMKFNAMGRYTIGDTEMLTKAYLEAGKPGLVVIDPPANFLGEVDEHRNSEVRKMLFVLVEWLEKYNVSCVLIMHINKQIGKGLDAVERILGSVGWGSSARMTVAFNKDPDNPGQLLCGGTKNNLGEEAEVLVYKIVKTDSLAKIEWIGKTDTSMEDAMNSVKKKSKGADAVEWLTGIFRERREWESDELRRMAREVGVTKYALFESPEVLALPIKKRKRINANGEQYWVWIASPEWPVGISGPSEHCSANPTEIPSSEIPSDSATARILHPY